MAIQYENVKQIKKETKGKSHTDTTHGSNCFSARNFTQVAFSL